MMKLSNPNPSDMADEQLLSSFVPELAVRELMCQYGSLQNIILHTYPQELSCIPGIGPIKARQFKAVCEMAKRIYKVNTVMPPIIQTPKDVFDTMQDMQYLAVEQFKILLLNSKNGIIGNELISQGTINATLVSPREIFHKAVKMLAASVVLVHNHPSGETTPSQEDITLTNKIVEAGKVLDIAVVDHCIIGKGKYVSFKERGLL